MLRHWLSAPFLIMADKIVVCSSRRSGTAQAAVRREGRVTGANGKTKRRKTAPLILTGSNTEMIK